MCDVSSLVTSRLFLRGVTVDPNVVDNVYSWCLAGDIYPASLMYDASTGRLLIRVGPLVDLTTEEPAMAYRFLDSFMDANALLSDGRFVGNDQVYYELAVILAGEPATDQMLIDALLDCTDLEPMVPEELHDMAAT